MPPSDRRKVPCPAPHPPASAYARLLGYYLGDGHIAQNSRTFSLRISCDRAYPGIIDDVDSAIATVHPQRRTYRVSAPGVTVVQSYWKHWPCLFPQHGPGRKHERALGMQPWQWEIVEAFPADFLRGLFHSDGSLSQNRVWKELADGPKSYLYPRWQFSNASEEILGWCGDALDLAEVRWRRSNTRVLSVSRRPDVARLTAMIGEKA